MIAGQANALTVYCELEGWNGGTIRQCVQHFETLDSSTQLERLRNLKERNVPVGQIVVVFSSSFTKGQLS